MLKCFQKLISDVKEIDDVIHHNYPQLTEQEEDTNTSEYKLQAVYQSVRDIFGDNATVFITVHGDNVSAKVHYN